MYCSKCGRKLPEKSKYCPSCGIELKDKANYESTVNPQSKISAESNKDSATSLLSSFLKIFLVYPLKITFFLVSLPFKILNPFPSSKQKKCPKCDSRKIKRIKPTWWENSKSASIMLHTGAGKQTKALNVCKDCGFSWEDR